MIMRRLIFLAALVAGLAPAIQPASAEHEQVTVCTDYWPPYVNREGEPLGELSRVVGMILDNMELEPDWTYFDFSYCRHRIAERDRVMLSFPWFRTGERAAQTHLSDPLFEATTRIYYNRHFNAFDGPVSDYSGYTFGKVASYAYGDRIEALTEDAAVFQTEHEAIEALLSHEIDLLPMTEGVVAAILARDFPDRLQLIRPLDGEAGTASLHVMAPRTPEGRALMDRFNQSLQELTRAGVVNLESPRPASGDGEGTGVAACESGGNRPDGASGSGDIARTVASEGFPVVLGRQVRDGSSAYLALPQGTKVIVLCWSPRIAKASASDRLYKTMVDESRVVVLDGPHVGQEVLVKNMHLAILGD